ncbi:putative thaumatin domain family protein isoform X1 [Zea mays]|uniref:Pathogenesis-related thaumatin superfamily protein n=1 Tax=Zea mays TaxID=4577 RepID=A0A1D6HVV4_MAIZE|nr:putative thaumatin domain family protein isoform X1 [Zea mays]ONM52362.1 Pathogenesis-related thaumatin superfamily protein [Zea mays]|eukprot:XP_008650876.1 putative thaumatin domain family protein isoform X1 [Zea mays]
MNRPRCAPGLAALAVASSFLCFLSPPGAESAGVFTIINRCKTTIWPAATPGDSFGGGGFALRPGQSAVFKAPAGGWSGRIWGRTGCSFDASGNGTCATGSCGTSLRCGASGATPVSLAEFTLASDRDFYDVSLVDGFNLPVTVRPVNGRGGNCSAAGCDGDLRQTCPPELAVRAGDAVVACRSACDVFDTDQYCCRGKFGSQPTCPPTPYSKRFKDACPTAYSYAYDDASSLFTCSGADYIITFCASSRKQQACSYHNNRLVCSDASRRSWPTITSKLLLLLLPPIIFSALQFPV